MSFIIIVIIIVFVTTFNMLSFVRCHISRSSDHGVGTWNTTFINIIIIIIHNSKERLLSRFVVPEGKAACEEYISVFSTN